MSCAAGIQSRGASSRSFLTKVGLDKAGSENDLLSSPKAVSNMEPVMATCLCP